MCALILKCNYSDSISGMAIEFAAQPNTPNPTNLTTATTDIEERLYIKNSVHC
jgi:hypothetical protein